METPLTGHAGACSWVIAPATNAAQASYQLTFLSPFPDGEAIKDETACGEPTRNLRGNKRPRRRICRNLTAADVAPFDGNAPCRPLLRTSAGKLLPALYARTFVVDENGDSTDRAGLFAPADPDTIIESATALLAHRLRRGVKILRAPEPLLRFLQLRLVSQPGPVFAVFFLDRYQQLIRFAELFHGQNSTVTVHPKEVVRETIACNAEQILCVRSDPQGDHQPTTADVEDARRVTRAMSLLQVPVLDYVIVGKSVTSLRARGVPSTYE